MDAPATLQSEWNFDGAEYNAIFQIKARAMMQFEDWDLDGVYWSLRNLRREINAKLNPTEMEKLEDDLIKLEAPRNNYLSEPESNSSNFYVELEDFYLSMCDLMKKHGIYFREGNDPRRAVLRV